MSKYIIRNGIPIRIEDSIDFEALDYIRQEKKLSDSKQVKDIGDQIENIIRKNYMNDINKYASRFNYKVADVIEAIKSKYYKNQMDLDDAVEEVLDNMVAMKNNLKDSTVKDSEFNKGDKVRIRNDFHIYMLAGKSGVITSVSGPDRDGDVYYDIKITEGPAKGETRSFTKRSFIKDSAIKDELSEKDSKELGIRDMIAFTQQRIRNLINDEYEAIDGYTSAISEFMRNYKETNDELYNQLAMVLADIKKEEFPHVGELNKCLSLIDEEEGRLFNKGVREAKKTVEKSMAPQEQEQVEE